ncbi:hypothetical protein ACOTVL_07505 [Aliarcobacter butzleri]
MFTDIVKISKADLYKEPKYIEKNYNIHFTQNIEKNFYDQISKYFDQYFIYKDRDFYTDMKSVTRATQNLMSHGTKESGTDKHRSLEHILDISGKYRTVCSEAAKVSTVFWQLLGYKSRVVWGGNHVMTEVYNDKFKKWVLVDSDGGVYGKHNGKLLNFLEAREFSRKGKNVFVDVVTNNLVEDPKYNIDLYARTQFFVLIDANNLFDFHNKFRDPLYILKYIFLDTENEINGLQSDEPNYQKLGNKEII